MPIQTDSEFQEFIDDILRYSKEPDLEEAVDASASLEDDDDNDAPNGRSYPGQATYDDPPPGYPQQELVKTYFQYYAFDPETMRMITYAFACDGIATTAQYDAWIDEARDNRKRGVECDNPDDVCWDGPSVAAFTLDAEGWNFFDHWDGDKWVNRSLYFHKVKLPKGGKKVDHRKNETFFRAKTLRPPPPSEPQSGAVYPKLPVLRMENHHLKYGVIARRPRNASDRDKLDHYKFDIYFRVGFKPALMCPEQNEERKLTLVIDPTVTNTGP